ncbi:uncharacterized protein LTR77_003522 [Saxophila tyrrhenica]|uniref:F-box domain-containing protein n=1 Tax=Saxophila tyrrhenica TaxID=1690608 RepID=A0AAV9PDW6_9PEZI|nr:hypothetical protein LTR77_003522 [Saxophila tyrrhenica]
MSAAHDVFGGTATDTMVTSAADAFFSTFELVEHIMLRLPRKDIYHLTRTAKICYNVSKESPRVRRELYGAAAPLDKLAPWIHNDLEVRDYHDEAATLLYELDVGITSPSGFEDFHEFKYETLRVPGIGFITTKHRLVLNGITEYDLYQDGEDSDYGEDSNDGKYSSELVAMSPTDASNRLPTTTPIRAVTMSANGLGDDNICCTLYNPGGLTMKDLYKVAAAIIDTDMLYNKSEPEPCENVGVVCYFDMLQVTRRYPITDSYTKKTKAKVYVEGAYYSAESQCPGSFHMG